MGDVIPDSTAAPIISALHFLAADIENGALVTIDPRKARVTMLPLNERKVKKGIEPIPAIYGVGTGGGTPEKR